MADAELLHFVGRLGDLGPGIVRSILQLQHVPVYWYHMTSVSWLERTLARTLAIMARRRYNGEEQSQFSSSSESSFSSESEDESSCDSDVSLELRNGDQKFKRLRRIFLNRPTNVKKKEKTYQQQRSPSRIRSQVETKLTSSKSLAVERQRPLQRRRSNNSSNSSDEGVPENSSKVVSSARPLQAAIDQHMHSLWEQMKRHSVQRDSTANQVQSMLEQAVDELQFLRKQEERALESQVRLIRESYALRLEVFQQQYLNKVAEIEDEMYASILRRQEECDATILAAAKKLQNQTQHVLLKDLAVMNREPVEAQLNSISLSTASSSESQPKVHRHRSVRPLHHDPLSSPRSSPCGVCTTKQTSPVSRQRAKLQALEEKLASFSPESLTRVKNELATPFRRNDPARTSEKPKRDAVSRHRHPACKIENQSEIEADEWQASPLSPLRKGPSYWKNGISHEGRGVVANAGSSEKDERIDERAGSGSERKAPVSLLSRRFLRPEEEEELRHLQASIGLAKDWMAKNSHA